MDKELGWFLERFNRPTHFFPAPEETLRRFKGKLPDTLLAYWQELGFSGFAGGLFWLTNPEDYESALEEWIGDTPIMEEDSYYVIGRTAFGDLFLWGEKNGYKYIVAPCLGWILQKDGNRDKIATYGADAAMRSFFAILNRDRCDMDGSDNKPLFERTIEKLGPLQADEVFAFEPSLIAGGKAQVKSIAKRNVHVHLSLLAQFGHREILDRQTLTQRTFGSAT